MTVVAEPTFFSSSGVDVAVTTTSADAGGTCCALRGARREQQERGPRGRGERSAGLARAKARRRRREPPCRAGPQRACSRKTAQRPRSRARAPPASSDRGSEIHAAKFEVRKKRTAEPTANPAMRSGAGALGERTAGEDDRRERRVDHDAARRRPPRDRSRSRGKRPRAPSRPEARRDPRAGAGARRSRARSRRGRRNWAGAGSAGTGRRGGPAGPRSSFEPPVRSRRRISEGPKGSRARGIGRRVLSGSSPRPRSVSSGRSPGFRIFRLRAPSRTRNRLLPILAPSGLPPEASPVTVAGAARDFHPLPFTERFKERRRGATIAPSRRTCKPGQ